MKKFNKLDKDCQMILLLNQWVMWSDSCDFGKDVSDPSEMLYNFKINYYKEYADLRFKAVDIICEKNLSYSDLPGVNNKNQNEIYKQCRDYFSLDEIKGDSRSVK